MVATIESVMRRIQVYLEDDLWNALHTRATKEGTTVSDLIRQSARERCLGKLEERREAMQALVGIRRGRADLSDSVGCVRHMRRGRRFDRLNK